MSLVNFITSNPDLVALVVTTVGGLIWQRGKKTKENDRWDVLLQLGRQVIPRLLADSKIFDDEYVRSKLRAYMVDGLQRLKVPMSPVVSDLVDEAVEHIHGELAQKLTEYHLNEFIKVQSKTAEMMK